MLMSRVQPEIQIQLWGLDISISVIKMLSGQAEGTALVRAREPEGWAPRIPMRHQKLRER